MMGTEDPQNKTELEKHTAQENVPPSCLLLPAQHCLQWLLHIPAAKPGAFATLMWPMFNPSLKFCSPMSLLLHWPGHSVFQKLLEFPPCQSHIVSPDLKHTSVSTWYCMQLFACGTHICAYLLVFRQPDQTVCLTLQECQPARLLRTVGLCP